jgi:hypothetical protein
MQIISFSKLVALGLLMAAPLASAYLEPTAVQAVAEKRYVVGLPCSTFDDEPLLTCH